MVRPHYPKRDFLVIRAALDLLEDLRPDLSGNGMSGSAAHALGLARTGALLAAGDPQLDPDDVFHGLEDFAAAPGGILHCLHAFPPQPWRTPRDGDRADTDAILATFPTFAMPAVDRARRRLSADGYTMVRILAAGIASSHVSAGGEMALDSLPALAGDLYRAVVLADGPLALLRQETV